MAAHFEIYKDKAGEFRFHLKAANGEIILVSEGYKQHASAVHGIESVKTNAPDDARYERKVSTSGKPHFNLKARNGEIIGSSQLYASEQTRDHGIEAVKKTAPEATIKDQTAA